MSRGPWFSVAVLALVLAGCADSDPSTVTAPPETPDASAVVTTTPSASSTPGAGGVDYLNKGVWHRSDGTTVTLPHSDYYGAVMWDDRLVATRSDGEVFSTADVIGADGKVVESLKTTSSVVVNDAGTTIAWVDTDGDVMTAWKDGRVAMAKVDLAAAGESIAYSAAAVTGGPSCREADGGGCSVYLNSGEGKPRRFDSHGIDENPLSKVVTYKDVSGKQIVTYVDKVLDDGSCGGLADLTEPDPTPTWTTCEYTVDRISPDGTHVIGPPAYFDGLGIGSIAVLDAATGKELGSYDVKNGFMAEWSWSTDGRVVLDRYEAGTWHLMAMSPTGEVVEIGEPTKGEDVDSPFTLIQH